MSVPTAEEITLKHCNTKTNDYGTFFSSISDSQCINAMIEFARLHCEAQQKTILKNAKLQNIYPKHVVNEHDEIIHYVIDKDSILNAYSPDKIK